MKQMAATHGIGKLRASFPLLPTRLFAHPFVPYRYPGSSCSLYMFPLLLAAGAGLQFQRAHTRFTATVAYHRMLT